MFEQLYPIMTRRGMVFATGMTWTHCDQRWCFWGGLLEQMDPPPRLGNGTLIAKLCRKLCAVKRSWLFSTSLRWKRHEGESQGFWPVKRDGRLVFMAIWQTA